MGMLPLNNFKNTMRQALGTLVEIEKVTPKKDATLLGTAKSIQSSHKAGNDITPLVECLMHLGMQLAREGDYDTAASKFDDAVKIAPAYMPARLGLLQAYVALDRNLDAAALAGHALALSTNAKDRLGVLLLMSENAKKLFHKTWSPDLLGDAIEYATRAHNEDKEDIRTVWAMVETNVLGYLHFTDPTAKNESYEIAKTQFQNLLEMARTGRGNTNEYLAKVVREARNGLALILNSSDIWWSTQFNELKAILAWGEFSSEETPRVRTAPLLLLQMPLQETMVCILAATAIISTMLPHGLSL